MIRRAVLLALLWGGAARAQTPVTIRVDEPGRGAGPATLQAILAAPHRVIAPGPTRILLPRDSSYRRSIVILGRSAAVAASVTGDVIVVGGDLYLHPGGRISGRAIAIGGGVYESSLARVEGGPMAYRDFTYDVTAIRGGFSLRYRSLTERQTPLLTWPGLNGIRLPSYDRSNGVSFPVAPRITVAPLVIEPRVTYRSQLGVVDPWLDTRVAIGGWTTLRASVGRGTFTNEKWIWPGLVNSIATLYSGDDMRNYYRGTRAEAAVARRWEWSTSSAEPYAGLRWESDRDVRPDSTARGGPWSFRGRHDLDDMLRPNPPIDPGTIASVLIGAAFRWESDALSARLDVGSEVGHLSPLESTGQGASTFAQATIDGRIGFPTFGTQRLRVEAHGLATMTNSAPQQRWAYVGGPATVPTLDALSRGGDQLIYVSAEYGIPIDRWSLSILGPPVVSLREVLAGAGVGQIPSIAQATGIRLRWSVAYTEYMVDPVTHQGFLAFGLTFPD